jgi:hypothetical protein
VPSYLNTACLPFVQQYYTLDNLENIKYCQNSNTRGAKSYHEFDAYMSALRDDEQRRYLIRFTQKLIQWRQIDQSNRTNLIMRRPVFGEDCRRAIKVGILFQDVFDVKRSKNLDRYNAYTPDDDLRTFHEVHSAPSTVFNPFTRALSLSRNSVEDWPDQSEDQIDETYYSTNALVKEVPLTLQLSNKKRR